MINLMNFMVPTPRVLDVRGVRASLKKAGFDHDAVTVFGDHDKIFIKKVGYLTESEWRLFCNMVNRLGARYRKDYGVYVVRVI